jgi:hypothetical protein
VDYGLVKLQPYRHMMSPASAYRFIVLSKHVTEAAGYGATRKVIKDAKSIYLLDSSPIYSSGHEAAPITI